MDGYRQKTITNQSTQQVGRAPYTLISAESKISTLNLCQKCSTPIRVFLTPFRVILISIRVIIGYQTFYTLKCQTDSDTIPGN